MQRLFYTFLIALLVTTAGAQSTGTVPVTVRKTSATKTPATYSGRQIIVGTGGGFTGESTTYYLLENGRLFGKRGQDSGFRFIGQQTAANTKRVFTALENACKIKSTRFDNPGNTYTFVGWKKGRQTYKVTWGAPDTTVPGAYPRFYTSFMAMIPASSRL